jgi:hypothetical protein
LFEDNKMKSTCARLLALSLICTLLTLSGCGQKQADTPTPAAPRDSLAVRLIAHDSLNVLALLLEEHRVELNESLAGSFVMAIDGVPGGDGWYWLYSVNGNMGQTAADRCVPDAGDTVVWHFRRSQ